MRVEYHTFGNGLFDATVVAVRTVNAVAGLKTFVSEERFGLSHRRVW